MNYPTAKTTKKNIKLFILENRFEIFAYSKIHRKETVVLVLQIIYIFFGELFPTESLELVHLKIFSGSIIINDVKFKRNFFMLCK